MPLIIAVTDFSDIAENAVNYACGLATGQKAKLLVLHSYMIPVMFNDVAMPASLINDTQQDAETEMNKLVTQLQQEYPELDIEGKVVYGDFIDCVNEYSGENGSPLLIILGNSSTGGTSWPDNTLGDALRKIKYPLLAIPPGVRYKRIQKICFAFDNKHVNNDASLQQITALALLLKGEFHVLNAQTDVHNQDNEPDFDPSAKELDHANPHYHMIFEVDSIDEGIENFVKENNIDLLMMVAHKYSFFEGIIHKSHTRGVARHLAAPILAVHDSHF